MNESKMSSWHIKIYIFIKMCEEWVIAVLCNIYKRNVEFWVASELQQNTFRQTLLRSTPHLYLLTPVCFVTGCSLLIWKMNSLLTSGWDLFSVSEQSGDLVRVRHKEKKRQKNRVFSHKAGIGDCLCTKRLNGKRKNTTFSCQNT